jgi:hypothetical protein
MQFPRKQLHRDFHNSRFWVQDMASSYQVVGRRRYLVSNINSVITIERTRNDIFDWVGMEAYKRISVAAGTLTRHKNTANLDLEIRLKDFFKFLLIYEAAAFILILAFFLYSDWRFGLVVGLFFALAGLMNYWVLKRTLDGFLSELERDIEYFR